MLHGGIFRRSQLVPKLGQATVNKQNTLHRWFPTISSGASRTYTKRAEAALINRWKHDDQPTIIDIPAGGKFTNPGFNVGISPRPNSNQQSLSTIVNFIAIY
jgi:hypothetical protein